MITFLKTMLNEQWVLDSGGERYCKLLPGLASASNLCHGCETHSKSKNKLNVFPRLVYEVAR